MTIQYDKFAAELAAADYLWTQFNHRLYGPIIREKNDWTIYQVYWCKTDPHGQVYLFDPVAWVETDLPKWVTIA